METEPRRKLHPLVATAAVAVIVLAGVGIAAFTGVLPSSHGSAAPAESAATNAAPAPSAVKAPLASKKEAARRSSTHRSALEEPAHKTETSATRSVQVAQSQPRCLDCGVVESVRAVEVKGQGSGLGAVAGGVAGALLGNQIGNGNGGRS